MSIFDDAFSSFAPTGGVTANDPGPLPVFGPGGLQGNLTSSQGQVPSENALTSPGFNLSPSSLPAVGGAPTGIPQAAASGGITGGATPPAATTGTTSGATVNNWFVRAIIVILGFIFVAVGLSQFGIVQRGIR